MTRPPEFILVGLNNTGTKSFMHYMLKAGLKCGQYVFFAETGPASRSRLLAYSDAPWFLAIDRCYIFDAKDINQLRALYEMNFTTRVVLLLRDPVEKAISSINYFNRMTDGMLWGLACGPVFNHSLFSLFYYFESAMCALLDVVFLNTFMRYSSAVNQLGSRVSDEPIFIDMKDITSTKTIDTMKMLEGKFHLTLPDDMAYFTRPVSTPLSQILWNGSLYFFPGERGLKIENPIQVALHIEDISEPYLGADLPLIMEMDQDIIPRGGKARLYLINDSPSDYLKIVDDPQAHAAMSVKAIDYLERLAKYDEWCANKDNFYSDSEVMDYFKKNKTFRERFLIAMEQELEVVYKYAPEIPKSWPYYNELKRI